MTTGTQKAVDRNVQVGDLNIHYLEWGEATAPPVIMVHGLSGNAHAFDNLAPHFLPKYHVVSVDVRGCIRGQLVGISYAKLDAACDIQLIVNHTKGGGVPRDRGRGQ